MLESIHAAVDDLDNAPKNHESSLMPLAPACLKSNPRCNKTLT